MNSFMCGDSSAGSERLIVDQEVTGSNPVPRAILPIDHIALLRQVFEVGMCRDSSVRSECLTVDQEATGSSPVPGTFFFTP